MEHVYETSDLGLASALTTCGFTVQDLKRQDAKRVLFCFEHEERIDEITKAYWDGSLKVSALQLLANQKLLKQRLYSTT